MEESSQFLKADGSVDTSTTTEDSSTAGSVLTFKRNSSSPADVRLCRAA